MLVELPGEVISKCVEVVMDKTVVLVVVAAVVDDVVVVLIGNSIIVSFETLTGSTKLFRLLYRLRVKFF